MIAKCFRFGICWGLFATFSATAHSEYSVDEQLRAFKENPRSFMGDHKNVQKYLQNYALKRRDSKTGAARVWAFESEEPLKQSVEFFSDENIADKSYVDMKNSFHEGVGRRLGRARIEVNDNPQTLLDGEIRYTKLKEMDKRYKRASLPESPWSGDYWPIYMGEIAKPYSNSSFPRSRNWKENSDYILNTLPNIDTINSSSADDLSPSAKYDLLIGDANMTLTKAMLADGQSYFEKKSSVETWMGICHGWAPAAYMEKRAKHSIKVMAMDGKTKITFYPSDLKALASLLWAKTSPPSRFIGSRCNIRHPNIDENGRIIDQNCFDTNPGTWHLSVVNSIGVLKRSFILDATYDYEIWNQPAYSYEYTYFNPETGKETHNLSEALVSKEDFKNDKFHKWRNDPRTVSFVGIAMKFTYIAETIPNKNKIDAEGRDRRVAVNYLYDLELDAQGNIIGGEWYHQEHPDFLWTPPHSTVAKSIGDQYLDNANDHSHWKKREKNHIPPSWQEAALKSSKNGQPLMRIVRELLQKANQIQFFGLHINQPNAERQ